MTETDIYVEIVNILRPSESVVAALQRLGGGKKGGAKGAKQVKKKSWQRSKVTDMETDTTGTVETEDDIKRRQAIEKLTDLCDKMMAMGHFDIYEETYEQVVRKLRMADIIEDDWEIGTPVLKPGERLAALLDFEDDPLLASTPAQWEYKWANPQEGQDADQVFGPFSVADMKSWSEQGFFSNGILVRMVGDSTFEPATNTTFE
jgi:CD2 antigen cytoplasmic tail-binding protein 2